MQYGLYITRNDTTYLMHTQWFLRISFTIVSSIDRCIFPYLIYSTWIIFGHIEHMLFACFRMGREEEER